MAGVIQLPERAIGVANSDSVYGAIFFGKPVSHCLIPSHAIASSTLWIFQHIHALCL